MICDESTARSFMWLRDKPSWLARNRETAMTTSSDTNTIDAASTGAEAEPLSHDRIESTRSSRRWGRTALTLAGSAVAVVAVCAGVFWLGRPSVPEACGIASDNGPVTVQEQRVVPAWNGSPTWGCLTTYSNGMTSMMVVG